MKIIAHRAGTDRYPEQSLASIHHSLSLGADYAEVDVRFTKDQVPVICHDDNTRRVFGLDENVWDMPLEKFLSLRYTADPAMRAYSLEQLFADDPGPLLLHIKDYAPQELDGILALIRKYRKKDGLVLGLVVPEAVAQVRAFDPGIATLAFMKPLELLDAFLASDVQIVRLWELWVTKERIGRIHGAGKLCWVMSGTHERPGCTDLSNLTRWRSMGVDGVLINELKPLSGWLRGPAAGDDSGASGCS